MYLTNNQRLDLHLEGNPDAPLSVVQAAVAATSYKGYVAPDYIAPPKGGSGGTHGGGAPGPSGEAGGADTATTKRSRKQ